ncbi:hypothetical protein AUJ46_02270 [Candidatus Peregrinibacteria bacterium CG1_02_54_53]|nr:MAG: hypothetical protein AUJ46_02270 [Candidatus Peregrinibacteria bacterium CG1_02_54_53]
MINKNRVCLAAFQTINHVIEIRSSGFVGTLALAEILLHTQSLVGCLGREKSTLRRVAERLTVFALR